MRTLLVNMKKKSVLDSAFLILFFMMARTALPQRILLAHTIKVSVTSTPVGLSVTVDDVGCTTPCVFAWVAGSVHTIAANTQSGGPGTQYAFNRWSDGGSASHTVTARRLGATYTALFSTQYFLTTTAVPSTEGV